MEQLSRAEQLEQKRIYWKQTGLTQAEYYRRHNLKHHQLICWRKRFLKTETDVSFVPLQSEDLLDLPDRR